MKHKANVAHCKLILQHLPSAMQLHQTKNTFPQKKISQTTRSTRKFLVLFSVVLKLTVKKKIKQFIHITRLRNWVCRVHCTRGGSVSSSEGTKRWRMRRTTPDGGINVYCCSAPSEGRGKAADTVASPIWLPSARTDCGVTTFPYPALFLSFRSFPVSLLLSLSVRPSFCQFRASPSLSLSFFSSLSLSVCVIYLFLSSAIFLLHHSHSSVFAAF